MRRYALPMTLDAAGRIPDLLTAHGIAVEPHRDIGSFQVLLCRRGPASVLLSFAKPAHWADVADERRDLVVVATLGASLWRFWNIPRENRLRREIIELLRPHGWSPAPPHGPSRGPS